MNRTLATLTAVLGVAVLAPATAAAGNPPQLTAAPTAEGSRLAPTPRQWGRWGGALAPNPRFWGRWGGRAPMPRLMPRINWIRV